MALEIKITIAVSCNWRSKTSHRILHKAEGTRCELLHLLQNIEAKTP